MGGEAAGAEAEVRCKPSEFRSLILETTRNEYPPGRTPGPCGGRAAARPYQCCGVQEAGIPCGDDVVPWTSVTEALRNGSFVLAPANKILEFLMLCFAKFKSLFKHVLKDTKSITSAWSRY